MDGKKERERNGAGDRWSTLFKVRAAKMNAAFEQGTSQDNEQSGGSGGGGDEHQNDKYVIIWIMASGLYTIGYTGLYEEAVNKYSIYFIHLHNHKHIKTTSIMFFLLRKPANL